MSRTQPLVTSAAALAFLVGCSGDDVTTNGATTPMSASFAVTPDLGGTWDWSNLEEVSFPPFIAMILGIVPEGELTHGRCESGGTMTLTQMNTDFEGIAEKLSNACITEGGQTFNQPGTTFIISDGRITGGRIHFSFATPTVNPCPHQAQISVAGDGSAVALSGKGRCILPGHPQSGAPLQADPPPQGRSRTLSWQAVRS